jgi:hypothetical protein
LQVSANASDKIARRDAKIAVELDVAELARAGGRPF